MEHIFIQIPAFDIVSFIQNGFHIFIVAGVFQKINEVIPVDLVNFNPEAVEIDSGKFDIHASFGRKHVSARRESDIRL